MSTARRQRVRIVRSQRNDDNKGASTTTLVVSHSNAKNRLLRQPLVLGMLQVQFLDIADRKSLALTCKELSQWAWCDQSWSRHAMYHYPDNRHTHHTIHPAYQLKDFLQPYNRYRLSRLDMNYITLTGCIDSVREQYPVHLTHFKRLQELHWVIRDQLDVQVIEAATHLPALGILSLQIMSSGQMSRIMQAIGQCQHLSSLEVGFYHQWSTQVSCDWAALTKLRQLKISWTSSRKGDPDYVRFQRVDLPESLEGLLLDNLHPIGTIAFLESAIKQCPKLKRLRLWGDSRVDHEYAPPNRTKEYADIVRVMLSAMCCLQSLVELRIFPIPSTLTTRSDFVVLKRLVNIEIFAAHSDGRNDDSLLDLFACEKLWPKLRHLELYRFERVGRMCLEQMDLSRLQVMSLFHCGLIDTPYVEHGEPAPELVPMTTDDVRRQCPRIQKIHIHPQGGQGGCAPLTPAGQGTTPP